MEQQVRAILAAEVNEYDAEELVALSCIADGPDAWFAEAVLSAGGRLEVTAPAAYAQRTTTPVRVLWPKGASR
ncbi:hypothetical protein ABZ916_24985 [Streptomyces sp. NPDC046853]|uniref:hypothetical protein n=1 Tax=Streptomyces sp. NPDC046853 TaxID=3154920 RepID=UPI0033D0DF14